jgi:hypothetical protein
MAGRSAGIQKEVEMKIAHDDSDLNVIITRGVAGYAPDIWLRWLSALPMTVRLTIDEARELAQALLFAADQARENKP